MTALAPKQRLLIIVSAVLAAVLLIAAVGHYQQNRCQLRLPQICLSLEYASTPDQITRGLGERDFMPTNHGMLFILPANNSGCFWMKDMRFNLDIVWLNANKQVIKLQPNLSPVSYPQTYCAPAAYVLEVNANVANQIKLGQQLSF